MLRQSLQHAWDRTFQAFGGWSLVVTLVAVPVVGFALHFLREGLEPMAGEFHIWLIYGVEAGGSVFLAIFFWNLACAPYRLERNRRLELEGKLARVGNLHPVNWNAWGARARFTVKEAAEILAGVEPSEDPPRGPVQAHLGQLKWDVEGRHLPLFVDVDPMNPLAGLDLGMANVFRRPVAQDDSLISAEAFRRYLAGRDDPDARRALGNLGGPARARVEQGAGGAPL